MKIAFQMDALERLSKPNDSTLYLARTAALRGYKLFHYEPQHLHMKVEKDGIQVTATGNPLIYKEGADEAWSLGARETHDLSGFDVILMRQDPPFDLSYITATHILEHLQPKVKIINDPAGVRNAPEKLLITDFPELMPPTLVTRDRDVIEEFRTKHNEIILKPLHGFAGHGVFHLRRNDDNLGALIETLGATNNEPWMIQPFLPVAAVGDKRIVMLNGEAVGVFRRMPAAGDVRGNMRLGAKPEAASMTARDKDICAALKPVLRERGLFLAGIDVIGDYLTEINVTSPTGLAVADRFANRTGKDSIPEKFWSLVAV